MYFDVQSMLASLQMPSLRLAELEFAIDHKIIDALHEDVEGIWLKESELLGEFNRLPVAVLFPERWEHGTALCAAVVKIVPQPDFSVTGEPYPL